MLEMSLRNRQCKRQTWPCVAWPTCELTLSVDERCPSSDLGLATGGAAGGVRMAFTVSGHGGMRWCLQSSAHTWPMDGLIVASGRRETARWSAPISGPVGPLGTAWRSHAGGAPPLLRHIRLWAPPGVPEASFHEEPGRHMGLSTHSRADAGCRCPAIFLELREAGPVPACRVLFRQDSLIISP